MLLTTISDNFEGIPVKSMLGDIQKWIPFIVFLGGASLGLVFYFVYALIKRNNNPISKQKETIDKEFLRKKFLETQLLEQENLQLKAEINKIFEKLNQLKQSTENPISHTLKPSSELEDLKLENEFLKRKVKKLKKENEKQLNKMRHSDTYLIKYKNFLNELDTAIGIAREDADFIEERTDKNVKIKPSKSSDQEEDKFAHYREKFKKPSEKSDFTAKLLEELKDEDEDDDDEDDFENDEQLIGSNLELTKLFGVTPEINLLLNKHNIFNLDDLSKTKIATLRKILADEGGQFQNVDPLNWPLQARLAQKGHWDVIKEYTEKMNKRTP